MRRRASGRSVDAYRRDPSQDREAVASHHQSNHRLPVAENTLNRQFTVAHPTRVWAGDRTDVWTTEGWLYFAVILDRYSRLVIGWAMGHWLTVELAEHARTMARANRNLPAGLLHHSDRGSPYTATRDQQLLATHGITASMSRTVIAGTTPGWNASSGRSSVTACLLGTTLPVTTRYGIASSTVRYSLIGSAGTRPSAITSPAEYEARTAVA